MSDLDTESSEGADAVVELDGERNAPAPHAAAAGEEVGPVRSGFQAASRARVVSLLATSEAGVLIPFALLFAVLSLMNDNFLTVQELTYVSRSFSWIAIAAIGAGIVIITGGIDLSVGSVMGLSGVVAAYVGTHHYGTAASIAAALGTGAGVGLINGVLITKLRLNPFIVTLGMLNVVRSLTYVLTSGYPLVGMPSSLTYLGQGDLAGVPVPVWFMLVLAIVFAWVLKMTTFGWRVYSIGGSEETTRLAGVRVDRVKVQVYLLAGVLGGLGGLLLTTRLGVGDSTIGIGYELSVIAAAIIGGVSLHGGQGTVIGVVLGAALIGVLTNGLVLLGVTSNWQQFALGAVIIAAVVIDRIRRARIATT